MSFVVTCCVILVVLLALYATGLYAIALTFVWARWRAGRRPEPIVTPATDASVTVIVPARNEGAMALRVIQSLLDQDTPAAVAIHLLVKDASDDSWPYLLDAFPDARLEPGASSVLVFASDRFAGPRTISVGFCGDDGKADKINWLMPRVTSTYVAILDCDHQAHPDWLRSALARLEHTGAALVQGRRNGLVADGLFSLWDSLHQHVGCELLNTAFDNTSLSVFFTGTTLVARTPLLQRHPLRQCITEDIDLSYTLFMEGERIVADAHVGSDEEVSPDLYSFLARRRRWANGHTDAFLRHLPRVWRAPLRWRDRLQFLFHGMHYLVAAAVFALHLGVGLLFSRTLSTEANLIALGLGVGVALAVARTQHLTGWRTRASEVIVLTGWFFPSMVVLGNLLLAWLLGDAARLAPPLPDAIMLIGLYALLAPLVVLLIGLGGFGLLTPTTTFVVIASYPVAFYLDLSGVLIGLADFLAGRSIWQAVARATRLTRLRPRARAASDAPEAPQATAGPSPISAEAPSDDTSRPRSDTGAALTPVISIPESWRPRAILALMARTIVMALPRRRAPMRTLIWLSIIAMLITAFVISRSTRLTQAALDCHLLGHDGDPWIVRPERIPGYCEAPAAPEGSRWSRRQGTFETTRVDSLSPPDPTFWEKLDSTFECNLSHFDPANVTPAPDGGTQLTLLHAARGDRAYTAGSIASHDTADARYRFGRFEAILKPARGSGIISAFFLHRRDPWQEIDVEFLGRDTTKLLLNVYFNPGVPGDTYNYGYAGTPVLIDLGFDAALDFHTYAIEWDVDELRWFVDDRLVHRRRAGRPTPIPQLPMRLYVNLWATCAEALAGPLNADALPATAHVRGVTVATRYTSVWYALWHLFDGLFSDGPTGSEPEPTTWQDDAEWLQRHRADRE